MITRFFCITLLIGSVGISISQSAYCYDPSHQGTVMEPSDVLRQQPSTINKDQIQEDVGADPLRIKVGHLLQTSHDLVQSKKYEEALAKLNELDAIEGKTDNENYIAQRTRVVIALRTNNEDALISSLERVVASGQLPELEKKDFIEELAKAYFKKKNYPKTILWASRYPSEDANSTEMHELLIQSYFFSKDFARASQEILAKIQASEKAGEIPSEGNLKMLVNCERELHNQAEYIKTIEKLATYYPTKEYWAELLSNVVSRPDFPEHLTLDVYRLMHATGQLTTASDFIDMSQLAMGAGYPVEAKKILDQGFQTKILGNGIDAAKQKEIKSQITDAANLQLKSIGKVEAELSAAGKNPQLFNLGYIYVVNGQFKKGIALMEQTIGTDRLLHKEEAELHMGIAYILAGQKDNAIKMFKMAQNRDDSVGELARYWSIYLAQPPI